MNRRTAELKQLQLPAHYSYPTRRIMCHTAPYDAVIHKCYFKPLISATKLSNLYQLFIIHVYENRHIDSFIVCLTY